MGYDQDTIIGKIRKLLALANGAGTEEEASAAMGKAQELLGSYNLSMAEINAAPGPNKSDSSKRVKDQYQRSAMFAYQRALWKAIVEANYCWYEATPVYKTNVLGVTMRSTYNHYLIGSEANVIVVKMMGDYLEETINRICPYKPGRDSSRSWTSWKEGCTARLSERIAQKRRNMEFESEHQQPAQGSTCTALTLRNVAQTEDDLNYREKWGQEAYEQRLAYRHNHEVCECKYCADRRQWRLSYEANKQPVIAESETEKARRLKKESENDAKWQRRWERERENEDKRNRRMWGKKDLGAYQAGAEAAEEIGLDSQIKGRDSAMIGGKQ